MFLLQPDIFNRDLVVLLLLSFLLAGTTGCFAWANRQAVKRLRWSFAMLLGTVALGGTLLLAYGAFVEPHILVTTTAHIPFPTREPLRVAVVSDIHIGPYKDHRWARHVVERVNNLLPDIVLLTGDFVLGQASDLTQLQPLADIHAPLGTFAVLGNHDFGLVQWLPWQENGDINDPSERIAEALQSMGITLLRNEHREVPWGEEHVFIAGIEDMWTRRNDLPKALDGVPENTPLILLSHNPSIILDPLATRAHLIVSGHTHGGQIRIPGDGPLTLLPTELGRHYDQGVFPVDEDSRLVISRGAGESGPRVRLFAWPEVFLITAE